jgi:hypothetical protein
LTGDTWSAIALPSSPATPIGDLTGVSCSTTATCVAVGNGFVATPLLHQILYAESLSQGVWTSQKLPLPPAAALNGFDAVPYLQGVSCPSTSFCVAVGYFRRVGTHESHPLAEVYSDGSWQAVSLPLPAGAHHDAGDGASLSSVSCTSSTSCVAVGTSDDEDYLTVETLAGQTWNADSLVSPAPGERVALSGLACPSEASCVAVGAYWEGATFSRPLAAILSDHLWTLQRLRVPANALTNAALNFPMLSSVSCTNPNSCIAVGADLIHSLYPAVVPIVEIFDGHKWDPIQISTSSPTNLSILWGISCSSSVDCVGVGEQDGSPLVESLNAGVWAPDVPSLPSSDSSGSLQAVSCPVSVKSCLGVGAGLGTGGVYPLAASN